jgi:hypothetical protein
MGISHRLTSRARRPVMVATAVAALAGGSVLGFAPAASAQPAGTCGQTFNPSTGGGEARWTLSCSGGKITMAGWVEDTDADGRCARVKGIFNGGIVRVTDGACPKGTRVKIYWVHPGTIANGYLYVS